MHSLNHKSFDINGRGGYSSVRRKHHGSSKGRQMDSNLSSRKIRDPQVIIIRNKFTKEIVDLEVGDFV